jgi:hypothetical protein
MLTLSMTLLQNTLGWSSGPVEIPDYLVCRCQTTLLTYLDTKESTYMGLNVQVARVPQLLVGKVPAYDQRPPLNPTSKHLVYGSSSTWTIEESTSTKTLKPDVQVSRVPQLLG